MRRPAALSRRDRWIVNLTTIGLAAVGASAIGVAAHAQVQAPQPAASAAGRITGPPPPPTTSRRPSAGPVGLPRSRPTVITIPAIGVHSLLMRLGLSISGAVQVPSTYTKAGWYDGSVTPGQPGPTIILGHVDSRAGPGVFFKLGALKPGERVRVRRADHHHVTFIITGVRSYSKDHFPTAAVYGATSLPTIRLITCGGTFDHASGHYVDNIIVFGQATGFTPRPSRRQ